MYTNMKMYCTMMIHGGLRRREPDLARGNPVQCGSSSSATKLIPSDRSAPEAVIVEEVAVLVVFDTERS